MSVDVPFSTSCIAIIIKIRVLSSDEIAEAAVVDDSEVEVVVIEVVVTEVVGTEVASTEDVVTGFSVMVSFW